MRPIVYHIRNNARARFYPAHETETPASLPNYPENSVDVKAFQTIPILLGHRLVNLDSCHYCFWVHRLKLK